MSFNVVREHQGIKDDKSEILSKKKIINEGLATFSISFTRTISNFKFFFDKLCVNAGWQGVRKNFPLGDYFIPTLQRSFQPQNSWDKSFFGGGVYGAGALRNKKTIWNNKKIMENMKECKTSNGYQRSKEVKGILNDENHINYDVLANIMV